MKTKNQSVNRMKPKNPMTTATASKAGPWVAEELPTRIAATMIAGTISTNIQMKATIPKGMLEYTRAPPGIQREPDQRDESGQHNQLVENEPHEKACADGGAASPNFANAAATVDDRIEQNEPKYAVNIKKDKEEHHDGCQQSHDPGQKLRIEKRVLTLQQQQMVAAAASLGKSAAGDIE